eukprot:s3037_g5.t1
MFMVFERCVGESSRKSLQLLVQSNDCTFLPGRKKGAVIRLHEQLEREDFLWKDGECLVAMLHGDLQQRDRDWAMERFREGDLLGSLLPSWVCCVERFGAAITIVDKANYKDGETLQKLAAELMACCGANETLLLQSACLPCQREFELLSGRTAVREKEEKERAAEKARNSGRTPVVLWIISNVGLMVTAYVYEII